MNESKNIDGGYIEITPEERRRRLGVLGQLLLFGVGMLLFLSVANHYGWDSMVKRRGISLVAALTIGIPTMWRFRSISLAENKGKTNVSPLPQIRMLSYSLVVLSAVCTFIHYTGQISPTMLYALPIVAIQIGLLGKIFLLHKNYEPAEDELPRYKKKLSFLFVVDSIIILLMMYRVFFM